VNERKAPPSHDESGSGSENGCVHVVYVQVMLTSYENGICFESVTFSSESGAVK
jgi:hypothetical protein